MGKGEIGTGDMLDPAREGGQQVKLICTECLRRVSLPHYIYWGRKWQSLKKCPYCKSRQLFNEDVAPKTLIERADKAELEYLEQLRKREESDTPEWVEERRKKIRAARAEGEERCDG